MLRGKAGRRTLLAGAAVAALAVAWFAGPGNSRVYLAEPRDEVERRDPAQLEAAGPAADVRPQLLGSAPPAAQREERGVAQTEVSVSIVAEGGGMPGETVVEAGEDESSLRACGVMSFGETRALTVRSSVRVWRARPFGRPSAFHEEGTARHAPHLGPLTLRLPRGHLSVHVRAVDADGAPVAALGVELVRASAAVARAITDAKGIVSWGGLAGGPSTGWEVRTQGGEDRFDPASSPGVAWNEDRSQGTATLQVRRRRLLTGRLVGPGVGVFDSITLVGLMPKMHRETWQPHVSKSGEFTQPIPSAVESVEAIQERRYADAPGDPTRVVFIVPQTLSLDASEPIEVRTVFGARAEGEVRDAQGRPVANAFVFAVAKSDLGAREREVRGRSVGPFATTDEHGRFRTATDLPGLWVFRVQPEGKSWAPVLSEVEVTGPGPTTVVLTLP